MNVVHKSNKFNKTEFFILEYLNYKYFQSSFLVNKFSEEFPYYICFVNRQSNLIFIEEHLKLLKYILQDN